jgi:hypothetical protein
MSPLRSATLQTRLPRVTIRTATLCERRLRLFDTPRYFSFIVYFSPAIVTMPFAFYIALRSFVLLKAPCAAAVCEAGTPLSPRHAARFALSRERFCRATASAAPRRRRSRRLAFFVDCHFRLLLSSWLRLAAVSFTRQTDGFQLLSSPCHFRFHFLADAGFRRR